VSLEKDSLVTSESASSAGSTEVTEKRTFPSRRWYSGLLHNFLLPVALLAVGAGVVVALGSVKPEEYVGDDLTLHGRMKSLPAVRVLPVRSLQGSSVPLQLTVDGVVVPYREARVAAEVAGRIIEKSPQCEAGSFVRKGQLLMRIDPTDYELEVQRLSRLREQEYEALGEIDQEMVNTQRVIDVAREDVQLQQNEVDRQSSLPPGYSSRGEVDQTKRALLQARQQLVSAENQLALLRQRRSRLEASERLAATQLQAAEVNLGRTEILAPIDGVIVSEQADLNTFVTRGNPLVTIEDTSKVEVSTSLRVDQLYWVLDQARDSINQESQEYKLPPTPALIEFEVSGRRDTVHRWHGRLVGYDGIGLDASTRTVPVRVLVDDPQSIADVDAESPGGRRMKALVRGMFVRVKLLIKPQTPLVVIPAEALRPGGRVWEYVIDDSVLMLPKAPSSGTLMDSPEVVRAASPGEMNSQGSPADDFDPGQWVAGSVFVREGINAVEAITLSDESAERQLGLDPKPRGDSDPGTNTWWICEVPRDTLANGSWVVVSPLGNLDDGSLSARTRRAMVDAETAVLEND